jgi:CDP-diacylglycerol--glycerol-3-phosphate 3-phosphatidyltransferase
MRDVYFTYFLASLAGLAAVAYAVRVAMRGVARSDRVSRIGGTALVGQEVMDWTYWAIEPIVRGLAALGITPNGLTWSALVLGIGAGVALAFGQFGLATLLATSSTIGDILDGQVARLTNSGSSRGELLDAAVDRYTEFAFIAGLVIYMHDSVVLLCLAMAALLASFMVSYASAKAEAMQVQAPRGLMRRHERSTYLICGVGFTSMFGDWIHDRWTDLPWTTPVLVALAVVAVVGNAAAVIRLVRIGRALR